MLRKAVSVLALLALTITGLVAAPTAASAAGSSDATLSNLSFNTVTGNGWYLTEGTRLWPSFSADQTYYYGYSAFTGVNFFATPTDAGATLKINGGDQNNQAMTPGNATPVEFDPKPGNIVTITVTAADAVTTKTYTINMSNVTMPQPELVSFAPTKFSTGGGDRGVAKLRNVIASNGCYFNFAYEYEYLLSNGETSRDNQNISQNISAPDANGIVEVKISGDGLYEAFRKDSTLADLKMTNTCQISDPNGVGWRYARGTTIDRGALSFFNPAVTAVEIPDTISQYDLVKVTGPGINGDAYLDIYIEDPATGTKLYFDRRDINSSSLYAYASGYDRNDVWLNAKNVKFVVEHYDYNNDDTVVLLYSKNVKYEPMKPTRVSMSPAKGSLLGGNTVRMSGRLLCGNEWGFSPVVTVGGKLATNVNVDWNDCHVRDSISGKEFDALDYLTFTVPASGVAGAMPVTVDVGFGPVTLTQKYVYGDRPTVTSIVPSTVSRAGGSMVTINGTSFGLSGTPIVTIDGQKSPFVIRVSATKLLAMVPASANTGAVEVNVVSSSGGGALDLPATMTLANSSANPTISSITPSKASISGGDLIKIAGTGFSTTATGVTIGGLPARVTSASATSLTVEVPSADAVGGVSVAVGTPTGLVTRSGAFSYVAPAGVATVSPAVIKSYQTGNAAKVTITGSGFGTKGTIKVGSASAVAYTATASGTTISGITIPTTKAGVISISILPAGAATPFGTSVTVSAPVINYVGPDPVSDDFVDYDPFKQTGGHYTMSSPASGGQVIRVQGTGFGNAGKIRFGTTLVTPTTYTDNIIIFTSPAATGTAVDLAVIPSAGTLTTVRKNAVLIGAPNVRPEITSIASELNNNRNDYRNTFSPSEDVDDVFVITGVGFNSTDNGASTVLQISNLDSNQWKTITPLSKSNTQIRFRAPRNMNVMEWTEVRVITKTDQITQNRGIFYVGVVPQPTEMSPSAGLCTKEALSIFTPAVVTATGSGVFGASGTVKLGGETISSSAVTWTDSLITVDFSAQTENISNPWGRKEISFVPADPALPVQNWVFDCGVSTDVTTKLNGSTADLTIAAGTNYTASAELNNPLPNTTYVQPADGYQYQSAEDYANNARGTNVRNGLPVAAGDWYVWANPKVATYDSQKYGSVAALNTVRISISGIPVTFTPKMTAGNVTTIEYRGQLGDGTNGSPNDLTYTKTNTADAVTEVTWQHRNHQCAVNDPNSGWSNGLPSDVAISWSWCGGDDSSVTSWEIRVGSFKMVTGGVDKAMYYLPTYEIFELTVNKRDLTITSIASEKIYDGNTSASLGKITATGALPNDNITLEWGFLNSVSFADEVVGTNKPLVTPGPISLDWGWRYRYNLTNPNFQLTGTIKKADAIVRLTPSPGSVVLANNTPINLTVETLDSRSSQPIDNAANAADPVLVNKTPGKCALNGNIVTAIAVGDCVIQATQAASTNYNAAVASRDSSTNIEEIIIKIYGAPKTLSVVADDLVIPTGEEYSPGYSMIGLIDGDTFENVEYDFYQGTTLLNAPPTAVGTYRIVPKLGSLTAVDAAAYNQVVKYIPGKLIITELPPVIGAVSPANGPEAGGNTVVISGTGFASVTSITIGEVTIRKPNFVVNGDGTTISFKMIKGKGATTVTLNAGVAQVTTDYTYDPPATPSVSGPLSLKLTLKLEIGAKFAGQNVVIKGGGLKANSDYTLVMNSKTVVIFKSKTDAKGNFLNTIKIPGKACIEAGKHSLTLSGTAPDGKKATDTAHFFINDKCEVVAQATKETSKSWTLNGFLFGFLQPTLNTGGVASLKALAPLIKGAKSITIYGYTETDTKSEAVKRANIILAQGRCDSVVAYLKTLGIKAVFKTVAKGGVDPVSVKEQWKNRRVVITATY